MIDLDELKPGSYRIEQGIAVVVPPKKRKRRKSRCGIVEPEVTFAIRADFRKGLSYRQLMAKFQLSYHPIRTALRGDMYISMIAEKEGLEPTLAAVCLVGQRRDKQPKNPRGNIGAWYRRSAEEFRPSLTPDEKRAKNRERMRRTRALQRAAATQTPGFDE